MTLFDDIVKTQEDKKLFQREGTVLEATEAISECKNRHNVSNEEIAEILDLTPETITRILDGDMDTTLRQISDILWVMGYQLKVSAVDIDSRLKREEKE